jgi:uncharacterized protein
MKTLTDIQLASTGRAAILRERFPVEQVILFGSKARGDDKLDSDIDLLVQTSQAMDWRQRRAVDRVLPDLQIEVGVMLNPIVIDSEEWTHGVWQALPFRKEVDRDGVLV